MKMNERKQVVTTDAEIAKNNRLSLMMDIHKQRQQEKETTTNHVEKQEMEEKMGKQTGTCEQCSRKNTRLTKHFNKEVCSSCAAMRGKVKNEPELVVAAMTEFHGDQYLAVRAGEQQNSAELDELVVGIVMPIDVQPVEFIDALDRAYDIEHERGLSIENIQDREKFYSELLQIIEQVMGVTAPGLTLEDPCFDDHLASLPDQIRKMYVDQERLAEKAAVLSKIRECISLDSAVPDDRIVATLHNLLLPPSSNLDQAFVGEIAAHLGMVELPTPEQVIKAVAELSLALAHAQKNCHDLTKANLQQHEQLNTLTRAMTANSIVSQVEGAGSKDGQLLDLALAALRGDTPVVADKLELMRGPLA